MRSSLGTRWFVFCLGQPNRSDQGRRGRPLRRWINASKTERGGVEWRRAPFQEAVNVDLPIKFPSDADVITGEVTRFRALSPEGRVRTLGELFTLYHFLAARSTRPEALARFALAEEQRDREAILEFIARHG